MIDTIFNEDCLEGMKRIPDKSIDMILCDLPYGTTDCKWDVVIPFDKLWEQYRRIIKKGSVIALTSSQPFSTKLVSSNYSMFKYEWIWNKKQSGSFLLAKYQPLKITESVLIFSHGTHNYYPIMTTGKQRIKGGADRAPELYKISGSLKYKSDQYYPTNIIEISNANKSGRIHPTQKPVPLFEYLIKTYTKELDTVLDNCMGSGTTAIACINTNRHYIGFEKDEGYYKKSLERIAKHTRQVRFE